MATMYTAHSAHSAHSAYPAHSVHGDEREPSSFRTLGSDRPWRFSWGAVLAGATISLGMWMLLHVLGLGTGLTAIDPDDPNSLEAIGMGTGIWSLIVPLVALFLGGLATAKVAGPITRLGGAIHGAVLWALMERSRWSTVILGVAAIAVAIMVWRMHVIWTVQIA